MALRDRCQGPWGRGQWVWLAAVHGVGVSSWMAEMEPRQAPAPSRLPSSSQGLKHRVGGPTQEPLQDINKRATRSLSSKLFFFFLAPNFFKKSLKKFFLIKKTKKLKR